MGTQVKRGFCGRGNRRNCAATNELCGRWCLWVVFITTDGETEAIPRRLGGLSLRSSITTRQSNEHSRQPAGKIKLPTRRQPRKNNKLFLLSRGRQATSLTTNIQRLGQYSCIPPQSHQLPFQFVELLQDRQSLLSIDYILLSPLRILSKQLPRSYRPHSLMDLSRLLDLAASHRRAVVEGENAAAAAAVSSMNHLKAASSAAGGGGFGDHHGGGGGLLGLGTTAADLAALLGSAGAPAAQYLHQQQQRAGLPSAASLASLLGLSPLASSSSSQQHLSGGGAQQQEQQQQAQAQADLLALHRNLLLEEQIRRELLSQSLLSAQLSGGGGGYFNHNKSSNNNDSNTTTSSAGFQGASSVDLFGKLAVAEGSLFGGGSGRGSNFLRRNNPLQHPESPPPLKKQRVGDHLPALLPQPRARQQAPALSAAAAVSSTSSSLAARARFPLPTAGGPSQGGRPIRVKDLEAFRASWQRIRDKNFRANAPTRRAFEKELFARQLFAGKVAASSTTTTTGGGNKRKL